MSDTYYLHDAETGELYDLGTGPWYQWQQQGMPKAREAVAAFLDEWMAGWALGQQPAWAQAVGDDVWAFVEGHPGAVVIHDDGVAMLGVEEGSRYEHDDLIVRRHHDGP